MPDGSSQLLTLPAADLGSAPTLELAPWHAGRPHLVANALMEARRVAPELGQVAERWIPRMPRKPLASQNIRTICRDPSSGPLLLDDAITCPWVGVNTDAAINALLFDGDHDDLDERIEELEAIPGCPIPDFQIDPWSGRFHGVLWLATPVRTAQGALPKPQKAADFAGRLMAAALGATFLPQKALIKSPWGCVSALTGQRILRGPIPSVPIRWEEYEARRRGGSDLMWITRPGTGPAELKAIIAALRPRFEFDAVSPKPKVNFRRDRGFPSALGRNCELFDIVRWWSYDTGETSTEVILGEVRRLNHSGVFPAPLPPSEEQSIARSIGRFMRTRYRPRASLDDRRGRDREDGAGLDLHAKRQLAARKSAAANAGDSDARIAAAVAALQAAGKRLTQAAIATEAGLSKSTVERRWKSSNGALSGSAPALGAPGPQAPPFERRNPSSSLVPTLADIARRDRAIRRAVAVLAAAAEAARRPGAEPSALPEVPREIAASSAVRKARHDAESAQADARRRAADRAARVEAAARRADFERRLREDAPAAWRWWRAELADLDMEWDARESAADPRDRAMVRTRREAVITGRWRSWKAACRAVRGNPPADPDVPW